MVSTSPSSSSTQRARTRPHASAREYAFSIAPSPASARTHARTRAGKRVRPLGVGRGEREGRIICCSRRKAPQHSYSCTTDRGPEERGEAGQGQGPHPNPAVVHAGVVCIARRDHHDAVASGCQSRRQRSANIPQSSCFGPGRCLHDPPRPRPVPPHSRPFLTKADVGLVISHPISAINTTSSRLHPPSRLLPSPHVPIPLAVSS